MSSNIKVKELQRKAERLELVLEGTRLGLWDWNPQTNEVTFDQRWAEMLGYDISEIEQNLESWQSKVHPEDIEQCFADITAHMEGKVPFYENVHRMKHKHGHWVYILDRGKIMERDADGKPIRFTGTHTDITREKLAEQRALDAVRSKDQFLALMTHELRTPLTGILGFLELLKNTELCHDQKEYCASIQMAGNHLLGIVNDILDISKAEAGHLEIRRSPTNIADLLSDVKMLVNKKALSKNLNLSFTVDPSTPDTILSNEAALKRVLINLVANAIKYSKIGSIHTHVDAKLLKGELYRIRFSVEDQGPGISTNFSKHLFSMFSREHQSSKIRGTGLGLAMSKPLVESLGGAIWLDPQYTEGSRFIFEIDSMKAAPVQKTKPCYNFEIKKVDLKGLKVLVAEDDHLNKRLINALLTKLNAGLTLVENGEQAVEAASSNEFDVVLMDLHMPVMDGETATKLLRAKHGDKLKIYCFSSGRGYTKSDEAKELFDGCLTKPIDFQEFSSTLDGLKKTA